MSKLKRSALTSSDTRWSRRHLRAARRLVRELRYGEALDMLGEAIARRPSAELYDYRGVLLALMRREEAALLDYEQALSLATIPVLQAQVLYHRSLLFGRCGSYDEALLDLQQAQRRAPGNATYREAMAALLSAPSNGSRMDRAAAAPQEKYTPHTLQGQGNMHEDELGVQA